MHSPFSVVTIWDKTSWAMLASADLPLDPLGAATVFAAMMRGRKGSRDEGWGNADGKGRRRVARTYTLLRFERVDLMCCVERNVV